MGTKWITVNSRPVSVDGVTGALRKCDAGFNCGLVVFYFLSWANICHSMTLAMCWNQMSCHTVSMILFSGTCAPHNVPLWPVSWNVLLMLPETPATVSWTLLDGQLVHRAHGRLHPTDTSLSRSTYALGLKVKVFLPAWYVFCVFLCAFSLPVHVQSNQVSETGVNAMTLVIIHTGK